MRLVGLTGGIACGKSTVANMLLEAHVPVIDCDAIAQECTERGHWGYRRVVNAFGGRILTPEGEIDRALLADIVFTNSAARRRLNAATHLPIAVQLVGRVMWAWLTFVPLLVVDMPLLFETGAYRLTWPRVLVACDGETQLGRLMARDKSGAGAAEARLESQMPLDAKLKLASVVVDNGGSLEATRVQVFQLAERLREGTTCQQMMTSPAAAAAVCLVVTAILAHSCKK